LISDALNRGNDRPFKKLSVGPSKGDFTSGSSLSADAR
jgi:hypothetical protein